MRALALVLTLTVGGSAAQEPPALTPASLLLATDATHVDERLLTAALAHHDPNVRAAAARLVSIYAVASLADAVATALHKETDTRAGTELTRALLFVRGDAGQPMAQTAALRLGGAAASVIKTWQARAGVKTAPAVPNDLMFSRTVDVWLPGLFTELAAAARCGLSDEPRAGYVRLTYRGDGRPRRVEVDKAGLSDRCASVLAAIGRTQLLEDDEPAGEGYQQWIVVPFSRSFAKCTEHLDGERLMGPSRAPQSPPRKIKDVRPQYPKDMQAQRVSGMVFVQGWISKEGCVTNLQVTKSTGIPFELEALRAMSGWEFEPPTRQGRAVGVRTTLTASFSVR